MISLILYVKLLWSSDKELYFFIKRTFGIIPNNISYYKTAFIHKSASVELSNGTSVNNERLEFLGDAIIDAIIADYLFTIYPEKSEGFLSKMRSKIVNRDFLNALSQKLKLNKHIVSHINNNSQKKNVYGNTFEAIIGAIYLDKGFKKTKKVIIKNIIEKYVDLKQLKSTEINFKSKLLEWGQKNKQNIEFICYNTNDSANRPEFESKVIIEGEEMEKGHGPTKKEAEQHAAEKALKKVFKS